MNPELVATLEQLRDIHLPGEPGWWPPAPGWWFIAFAVSGILFCLVWWIYRKARAGRPFRQFKTAIMALPLQPGSAQTDLQTMSELTRRLAITLYGRERVASLTGKSWLALLDSLSGSTDFTDGPGRLLENGPYQPVVIDQLQTLRDCLVALGQQGRPPSGGGRS